MVDKDDIRKPFEHVVSVTLHGEFYRAALDNLAAAIELQGRLNGSDGEGFEWVHEKLQGMDRQYRTVLVAIVFSAITAEALINHYGISRIGETQFKTWFEKLSIPLKWLFVPRAPEGKRLEPRREPFQGLARLVRLRHTLVHYKPVKRTGIELWKEEYRVATLDDAECAVLAVHRLASWLHCIDPDFDLGDIAIPSDSYESVQFLEAYACVLEKRPR